MKPYDETTGWDRLWRDFLMSVVGAVLFPFVLLYYIYDEIECWLWIRKHRDD